MTDRARQTIIRSDSMDPRSLALAVSPTAAPVLFIVGGAKTMTDRDLAKLEPLFFRHLAPIVETLAHDRWKPIVVTGGTDHGVMSLTGQIFRERAPSCTLVGVAPRARLKGFSGHTQDPARPPVAPEPNHHFLITTPGRDFGDELPVLVGLVERISEGNVSVIVIGGGEGTRGEVETARQRGWPIMFLHGTGGLADIEAEAALRSARGESGDWQRLRDLQPSATLQGILAAAGNNARRPMPSDAPSVSTLGAVTPLVRKTGREAVVSLNDPIGIKRLLGWRIGDPALRDAWRRAAWFDQVASQLKPGSRHLFRATLAVGVLTTLFSVAASIVDGSLWKEVLQIATTMTAASGAALIGWITKRGRDRSWIVLRAAGEQIRREIYLYRCGAGAYTSRKAPLVFAEIVSDVELSVATSVPGKVGFDPGHAWPSIAVWSFIPSGDHAFGTLSAEQYIEVRVLHQLNYFGSGTAKDDRRAGTSLLLVLGLALTSTLASQILKPSVIAAVAVIAALQAAVASWLVFDQTDQRVRQMTSAAAGLRKVVATWRGSARIGDPRVSSLVEGCESILETENNDWMRVLSLARDTISALRSPA